MRLIEPHLLDAVSGGRPLSVGPPSDGGGPPPDHFPAPTWPVFLPPPEP